MQESALILMYHRIAEVDSDPWALSVSPKHFGEHLEVLKQTTHPVSLQRLLRDMNSSNISHRSIVITFDDGYASCFERGMAVLEDVGCKAIQFLVSGRIGKTNDWDATGEPIVHKSQVRDWLANGHLIGSHTNTHPDLTKLPERDAREEIMASRKRLEDTFGVAVNHFAYPLGACNERLVGIVRESGYATAVTTEFGVNDDGTNPYRLRRILAYRSLRELLASAIFSRSE